MSDPINTFVSIHQISETTGPVIRHTADIADLVVNAGLSSAVQEELWVVTIDGARNTRSIYRVAKGGYHDCDVAIPTILSPVFLSATDRFIVAHNHPARDLAPTRHDLDLTWRLSEAADLLELMFEDHLIVSSDGGWYSLKGHRQMRPK